jgi:siroheme synthase-like protein
MSAPRFSPMALDLVGLRCVVVGGGAVGTRKALKLAESGARVTVVSPEVTEALARSAAEGEVSWVPEPFDEEHLRDVFLVVTATDDEAANARVAEAAFRRGVLLCDSTSARRTRVIFGATLALDDATVAVFTDGRDPTHSRRLRDRIARFLGAPSPAAVGGTVDPSVPAARREAPC